jgi:adenine-specific DNA-methyltransferase
LLLARELLHESGSVFVQINDENLPLVREVAGEVFGRKNMAAQITFRTTAQLLGNFLGTNSDYLVWLAKDIRQLKYRPLFTEKTLDDDVGARFTRIELTDGSRRVMTTEERANPTTVPSGARIYRHGDLTSQGATPTPTTTVPFEFDGHTFHPGLNRHWTTTVEGLRVLDLCGRLAAPTPNSLTYVRYLDDFAVGQINNVWSDTQTGAFTDPKVYAVQTNTKVIARCLLMTTDPGDIVLDPTCGSGTTAATSLYALPNCGAPLLPFAIC